MYVALLIEAPTFPEFICPHVTLSYGVHIHDYVTLWSVKSLLSGYLTPRTLSGTWFVEHGRTGFKICRNSELFYLCQQLRDVLVHFGDGEDADRTWRTGLDFHISWSTPYDYHDAD